MHKQISAAALKNADAVVQAFKSLCEENEEFRSAIEGTTKSIESIFSRLSIWGDALRRAIKMDFPVARQEGNKIYLS